MKNILVLILFIAIFGGAIVLIIVSAIRRREISFEGSVIDKNIIEQQRMNNNNMMNRTNGIVLGNMNGGVTHEYKIKVKTDQGKEINYKISEGMYETIKIGDRVSKPHGTTEIAIVSSTQNTTTQPAVTNQAVPPAPQPPTTPPASPPQNNNPQSFA